MRRLLFFLPMLTLLLLAGCSLLEQINGADTAVSPTPTPTAQPTTVAPAGATPNAESNPITISNTTTTLTVWIAPEIFNASEAGTAVLESQLQAFQNTHPDTLFIYQSKSVSGQGSILNYLRTGKNVAPNILPDLVAIPADQLSIGYNEGLFYPLNGFIAPTDLEDLYSAGLEIALQDEQIIGYPFILTNLPQLAYNSEIITSSTTSSWSQFIQTPDARFAFPANGPAGATLLLELYFDAGGTLLNEAGQQELQLDPLVTALTQLEQGRQNEFIVAQSSNINTIEDSWRLLENGTVTFAQTSAEQYLSSHNDDSPISYQPIPGINDELIPLVNGWVWALSSADPAKQELATDLIKLLTQADNLGEWALASNHLPSRRSAVASWPSELEGDYVPFVQQQLLQAELHPLSEGDKIMTALGNAVFDVVSLSKTPQAAAEAALLSLQE